jgi:hypothetical protein
MPVSGNMIVDIVGYPVRFGVNDESMLDVLRNRYRHFLDSTASPIVEFDIEVLPSPPGGDSDLSVRRDGTQWRMSRGDFDARWDSRTRCGCIRQTLNPYSTDSVLRIVHSLLLGSDRGFLLHASSLVIDEQAYVFTGPSGSGKTTMARLAPANAVLLTDEISCIRRTAEGWMAFGTPFAGELGTSGNRVSAPIAGVYRLEKGGTNTIDTLRQGDAIRTLMRNVLFFASDENRRAQVLDTVCELTSDVPVARLTFTPAAAAWEMVRSHGARHESPFHTLETC